MWPRDVIWRNRTGSTLAQVMDCCLTAPSHHLDQYRLIINKDPSHSFWTEGTNQQTILKIAFVQSKCPRKQWVNRWWREPLIWGPWIEWLIFRCDIFEYISFNEILRFWLIIRWGDFPYVQFVFHDDVIKWKHFPCYWPFVRGIHRSPVNSPHKGQWRGALVFSLICTWLNGWVNNREAGDLRRHRAHYDVIVMCYWFAAEQASSHWLHLQWTRSLTHICVNKLKSINSSKSYDPCMSQCTILPSIQIMFGAKPFFWNNAVLSFNGPLATNCREI